MNVLKSFSVEQKLAKAPKEVIKAVQSQLVKVDLLEGNIDGVAGPLTLAAFAKFKKSEYLEYPDVLGKSTVIALLEATEDRKPPKDVQTIGDSKHKALLPGVGWLTGDNALFLGGNFTWGEFTKNLTRIPQNENVVNNIYRLAEHLEAVRSRFDGAAIIITSAYRPPFVNSAVGGASNSQHLYGTAADIVVSGINPHEVYKRLNTWHGSKGGLGDSASFTHIDLRNYRARWNYGNA